MRKNLITKCGTNVDCFECVVLVYDLKLFLFYSILQTNVLDVSFVPRVETIF